MTIQKNNLSQESWLNTVTILYRSLDPKELSLIEQSGRKRFPQRLSDQHIFYPVLNEEHAVQIARDWKVPASGSNIDGILRKHLITIPTSFKMQQIINDILSYFYTTLSSS